MTCDFQQCGILTTVAEPVQPPFNLRESPYIGRSVAKHLYNMQATSKGSDQTACMRRLI